MFITNVISVRLILIFFYILLFFYIIVPSTTAIDWIRYSNNPILSSSNNWDNDVTAPSIILDENKLKMWYQGGGINPWAIGYAESTDGIHWQKTISTSILNPFNENQLIERSIQEPSVLKNNIYHMWFNSEHNDTYNIRYAYSSDGINWTKHNGYVLTGESAWENKGVSNPSVIYKDGKYLLWYSGWGYSSPWKVGFAESIDGINWIKSQSNPINLPNLGHVSGQTVKYINGEYHMFYHTGSYMPDNIYHVKSNDGKNWSCVDSCSIFSNSYSFDSVMKVSPDIIYYNSDYYIYYAGYNGSRWQIGLATEKPINQIDKNPIIIIPGLFASWNKQALIYNQPVNQSNWQLNPFIHEYDGIRQSLINLGFIENQDFYIFTYDWRKSVNEISDDLNIFINQRYNESIHRINLIGHSLGGLVARIYAQKYGTDKLNKIITVGTPHQGVPQVYKALEAGEIDRYNDFLWLSQRLILQLQKNRFVSDKTIINEKLPVIKDLLSIYDFLKNADNQTISISQMSLKNDFLLSYQAFIPKIFPILTSVVGEKGDSPFGYKVTQPTSIDQLLGYYNDGRPIETLNRLGDYTVNSFSAKIGDNQEILSNLDHGQIIYEKSAIKSIFDRLPLPYQDNQIVAGAGTKITPSLLFLVFSPVKLSITYNDQQFQENDGLIFIPNATDGIYQIQATAQNQSGPYSIIIGQISENQEKWGKIESNIYQPNQTDRYELEFNTTNPVSIEDQLTTTQLINQLIHYLFGEEKLTEYYNQLKLYYQNQDVKNFQTALLKLHEAYLDKFEIRDTQTKLKILNAVSLIEIIYSKEVNNSYIKLDLLTKKYDKIKKHIELKENKLIEKKNKNENVEEKTLILLEIKNRFKEIEKNLSENKLSLAEILIETCERLMKAI